MKHKQNILTLGQRNNNPGNIRYNPNNRWRGLTGKDKRGFCIFSDINYGYRAMVILLKRYISFGFDTPFRIINRYAPSNENKTDAYISFVCERSGILPTEIIYDGSSKFYDLISAMCFYESKIDITGLMIKEIYDSLR